MKLEQGENRLFLLDETGRLAAEITFPQVEPGVWCIDHTFVSPALRGQGVAGRLVEAALKEIRRRGGTAAATCPYAAAWMKNHGK